MGRWIETDGGKLHEPDEQSARKNKRKIKTGPRKTLHTRILPRRLLPHSLNHPEPTALQNRLRITESTRRTLRGLNGIRIFLCPSPDGAVQGHDLRFHERCNATRGVSHVYTRRWRYQSN